MAVWYSAMSDTWDTWASSTTTTATDCTWGFWCDSTATTTITNCTHVASSTAWITWNASGSSGRRIVAARQTPEQEAAARRSEEEYRTRQKAEAERYRVAKERAEGLLYEHLSDEQRAQIKRDKFFVVQGGKTGRRYKINAGGGLVANVHEIDEAGRVQRRLCAHIDHAVNSPVWDHFLAQKLMLEHQEEAFLRVANDHGR